jgi:hypothetical protein
MLSPEDITNTRTLLQALARDDAQLLDDCAQQLSNIDDDVLLGYVSAHTEKNILIIGACYAIQHPTLERKPEHILHYGVQVLNREVNLNIQALLLMRLSTAQTALIQDLEHQIHAHTRYTTSLRLQLLLCNHPSPQVQQSGPVLDDIFYRALNWALLAKPTPQTQKFVRSIENIKKVTLSYFEAKKAGFSFAECQAIAEAVTVLSNKVARGLEQQDIDTFIQRTKPYLHCNRMQVALLGLIGAALGLIAGCILGGGIPGAFIGAALGMTLFGGTCFHQHHRDHPLTHVTEAAIAAL